MSSDELKPLARLDVHSALEKLHRDYEAYRANDFTDLIKFAVEYLLENYRAMRDAEGLDHQKSDILQGRILQLKEFATIPETVMRAQLAKLQNEEREQNLERTEAELSGGQTGNSGASETVENVYGY